MTKRQEELLRILEDKRHGSAEILQRLNRHFLLHSSDPDYVQSVIIKTKTLLSHFSIVNNYLKRLQDVLDKNNSISLNNYLLNVENSEIVIYRNIFDKLKKLMQKDCTVLTLSHSKTVLEVLKLWVLNENKLKVIVCESRPGLEGRILAKELVKQVINVELITDAMMAIKVPEVNAVLLGADQILTTGNIVNKIGSKMLAVIAKLYKVPVYVLASKQKITERKYFKMTNDYPEQVWKYKHAQLKVTNNLFEVVENELITKIITE